jgi:hypothetical protein
VVAEVLRVADRKRRHGVELRQMRHLVGGAPARGVRRQFPGGGRHADEHRFERCLFGGQVVDDGIENGWHGRDATAISGRWAVFGASSRARHFNMLTKRLSRLPDRWRCHGESVTL